MKTIAVTDRGVYGEDFMNSLRRAAATKPHAVILREKDLCSNEYHALARECLPICAEYDVPLIVNTFTDVAEVLSIDNVQVSFGQFSEQSNYLCKKFTRIGVSVHSKEEAVIAKRLGASYLIAGHIFETKSKEGVPARGLEFLRDICAAVPVDVYAIGGITRENAQSALDAGASGVCMIRGIFALENTVNKGDL